MKNKENLENQEQTEQNNTEMPSQKEASKSFHINLHFILLAVIIFIAAFAVYRVYKWNQSGEQLEIDPDVDTSEFDIETLDMILPMDAALLEGREDDGTTTILCLGNNPFADDKNIDNLAGRIASKTGSVVYDGSFPYSTAAIKYPTYNPEFTRDYFNLHYVVECLRTGDFTYMEKFAGYEPDPRYAESTEILKKVDMEKVDILVMMYDSTDYLVCTPSDDPDSPFNLTAFTGGLRSGLQTIKATWPHIRIFLMSPTYGQYLDENGELHSGTTYDAGNGTLYHYVVKESEVAMDCGVSFIDNFLGTINEDNYEHYMTDHIHYNDEGREKLAERISDVINSSAGTAAPD